jgi:dTDP-glucose pyrophosphorylase
LFTLNRLLLLGWSGDEFRRYHNALFVQSGIQTMSSAAVPCLVVLAAGMGSRFGGDKQLAVLGNTGRTLLHFSAMDAYQAGVRKLVLVIRPELIAALQQQVLLHLPADLKVVLVVQNPADLPNGISADPRKKPWGTAHALWCARSAVANDPMIVINADDYYGVKAMQLLVQHFSNATPDWAMVAFPLARTLSAHGGVNRGVCVVAQSYLKSVEEYCQITRQNTLTLLGINSQGQAVQLAPDAPVSMNIWGFSAAIMQQLELALTAFFQAKPDDKTECYLPAVVDKALKQTQRLQVYLSDEAWFGVTYPADLPEIVEHFQTKQQEAGHNLHI